jgi:hypothetical protein
MVFHRWKTSRCLFSTTEAWCGCVAQTGLVSDTKATSASDGAREGGSVTDQSDRAGVSSERSKEADVTVPRIDS